MTKKSWIVFSACALAGAAMIGRRLTDARSQAKREASRCDRLLRGLDARVASFR